MKRRERVLYIVIAILCVVVVVLGALFYVMSNRLQEMQAQAQAMNTLMDDTLQQVESGAVTASADSEESGGVNDEYVAVDEEDSDEAEEEAAPEEEAAAEEDNSSEEEDASESDDDSEDNTPTEEATIKKSKNSSETDNFEVLEPQLEEMISSYQSQYGGNWAVYVRDLDSGDRLTIDSTHMMQAASLIKLYIMGAVYENYDSLSSSSDIDGLLTQMITVSDNDAANQLVTILGGGDASTGMAMVNSFCTEYEFADTSMGRMLLESNENGDNYTSVEDCGKFLYRVCQEKFPHSVEMLELLENQQVRTKIPAGIPDGVVVANKTGELDDVQNDAAIVYGETPYIVCIMSEGVSGTDGPVDAIATMSSGIYGFLNQ